MNLIPRGRVWRLESSRLVRVTLVILVLVLLINGIYQVFDKSSDQELENISFKAPVIKPKVYGRHLYGEEMVENQIKSSEDKTQNKSFEIFRVSLEKGHDQTHGLRSDIEINVNAMDQQKFNMESREMIKRNYGGLPCAWVPELPSEV